MLSPQDWNIMFIQDCRILYARHSGIGLYILRDVDSQYIGDVLTFYFPQKNFRQGNIEDPPTLASSDLLSAVL